MKKITLLLILYGLPLSFLIGQTTYTTRAAFDAAVTGTTNTLHFDNLTAGDLVASGDDLTAGPDVGEVTFTNSITDVDLRISDQFITSTPSNYFGTETDAGVKDALIGSDEFTMTFNQAVYGVGLYIIVGNNMTVLADDWTLTLNTGEVASSVAVVDPTITIAGAKVYFLGIRKTEGFTSAKFSSVNTFGLRYDLEDIIIEANPTITLAATISTASEGGTTALVYQFTRTSTVGTLEVNFSVEGTAQDSDYTVSGHTSYASGAGSITFADGSATADLTVAMVDDSLIEGDETVVVKIANPIP